MTVPDFDEALKACAPAQQSGVDLILAALDPAQAKKVDRALRDRTVGPTRLAKALTLMGHKIGDGAIRSWRDRNAPA